MNYANYNEEDPRLVSGKTGSRKSAIIDADGFEKRNERKAKLIKKITERTDWEKVNSKRRKAMNKAKEQVKVESVNEDIITMDEAIETAISEDKIAIVNNTTGEVEFVDACLVDNK